MAKLDPSLYVSYEHREYTGSLSKTQLEAPEK